jgi:alpha-tubulin suppressor-like RCC1 family protein
MRTLGLRLQLAGLLALAGCLPQVPVQAPRTARVSIRARALAATVPGATALRLTVSAVDMAPLQADLPLDGTVVNLEIAAGLDRVFTVDAYAGTVRTHTGSTLVRELVAGLATTVSIQLAPIGADVTPPTVVAVAPSSGAVGVAASTLVAVTFSEAVDPATVSATTFTLAAGAAPVTGALAISGASATFTPLVPLADSTTYTATLTSGVKDLAGNAMASAYAWSFTTAAPPDVTPPTIASVTPASGATGVSTAATVNVTFSEPIAASSVDASSFSVTLSGVPVTGTLAVSGSTATFTPAAPLGSGLTYVASLSTAIQDLAGNALASISTWSFTTALPTTAPTVVSTTPSSGATWVAYDDPMVIDFSMAMDPATLTAATVTLQGPGGPVSGAVAASGSRATFTPAAALCNPCAFTGTVTTSAHALDGSPLAASATFTFSTGLAPLQAPSRLGAAGIATLAVPEDQTVWAWGTNIAGALGNGGADSAVFLGPVQAVGLPAVQGVDGAAWYSLALDATGAVWGWGWGPNLGVTTNQFRPVPIAGLTGITAISAGYRHGLARRTDGGVMGWGFEDPLVIDPPIGSTAARQLPGLADVVAVAAGENFSMALRSDGAVLAWGNGGLGQLGNGGTASRGTPARVPGLTGVVAIAAESFTGLALRYDGTVWAWGHNLEGEAGVGSANPVQLVPAPVLAGVTAMATGNFHGLALMRDGTVKSWGYNNNGRLGDGTSSNRISPVAVVGLTGVLEVSGGEFHSAARKGDGTVWTWGDNSYAQLGDGTQTESWVPVQVGGGFNVDLIFPLFTWMGGGTTHSGQGSVYGVYGVADPANLPGERSFATSWSHPSGQLWLFGGYRYAGTGAQRDLADLWKFDGTNWTWMGGSSGADNTSWGTKGVPSSGNSPSSRNSAASWTDLAGNLWLFGGYGWDTNVSYGNLDDLWRFDGVTWTWMAGSSSSNQPGAPARPAGSRAASSGSSAGGGTTRQARSGSSATCGASTGRAGPSWVGARWRGRVASTAPGGWPTRPTTRAPAPTPSPGPMGPVVSGSSEGRATPPPPMEISPTSGCSMAPAGPGWAAGTAGARPRSAARQGSPIQPTRPVSGATRSAGPTGAGASGSSAGTATTPPERTAFSPTSGCSMAPAGPGWVGARWRTRPASTAPRAWPTRPTIPAAATRRSPSWTPAARSGSSAAMAWAPTVSRGISTISGACAESLPWLAALDHRLT